MNVRLMFNIIGIALMFLSLFMMLPIGVSLIYKQSDIIPLTFSFFVTLISGLILYLVTYKHKREEIRHRDAFMIVTVTWLMISLFGAIPFMFSGTFHSFTDAYFEAMAGFTTTGASVLKDVEVVPKGVLFWRSMIQWIGGMGIIVFAIAILPFLGTGGMQLFKAEVPEISIDKLRPRILDTAKALWIIYVGITTVDIVLLKAGGMDLYDAICHAFTTMATGGFSTKNASIGHYHSPFIEYTTSVFMFLAG
ncbi:MAG: TrkH family potassium uptake protein, partial [Nitrospira sp.]|nr:TrkH family potassium uptake protein [Nitrospira sp.]